MSARRNFLKTTALASAAIAVKPILDTDFSFAQKAKKPIVLSTWNFGLKANEAAWNVLKSGGRALDAVETGVKITEADPESPPSKSSQPETEEAHPKPQSAWEP